jgi:predicted nucleotidyltransferase
VTEISAQILSNMSKSMSMDIKKDIAKILAGYPAIKLALLFGSLSRNEARADSDLDLAVAATHQLDAGEKICLITDMAQLSGRPVDLVDLQSAGGLILKEALTKGVLIYCTDKNLYAELIKKMLYNQADWIPYRDRILADRRRAWINS